MIDPSIVPELLIRGAAVGAFAILSLAVLHGGRTPARTTGALFFLAVAAHTVTQSDLAFAAIGLLATPIWIMSVTAAGLFWAFATELFSDRAQLRAARFVPASVLLVVGVAGAAAPPPIARGLWLLHNVISALLLVHVLTVVHSGWREDLVEARRRLRSPLIVAGALYALVVVGVESAEFSRPSIVSLSIFGALALLVMAMLSAAAFLRVDPDLFGMTRLPASRTVTMDDRVLVEQLVDTFDSQQLWREEGLTIGGLAERLSIPEHRLRRLINDGLGYRNFAAFINERRIAAAKISLADAAGRRKSVATIAFEVGFGSIGPFNRAFRESTGQAPTDWRRASDTSPISEKPD